MLCCPSVRLAIESDRASIETLLYGSHAGLDLTTRPGSRYALVLEDASGGVAAAAVVTIDPPHQRGHLAMLVIADEVEGNGLENRVIAVAEALCSAHGCPTLDVPAPVIPQAA